jgi:hypothetical protein
MTLKRATESEIREMKVGDVFLHPFHYSGIGTSTFFVIREIGPDTERFGKFCRLMVGERWGTLFSHEDPSYYENEKIWANDLTDPIPENFLHLFNK